MKRHLRTLYSINPKDRCNCLSCGKYVYEQFMIKHATWRSVINVSGVIHIKCLEELLGRQLDLDDFMDNKVNQLLFIGYNLAKKTQE